jgi:hypothetical protein
MAELSMLYQAALKLTYDPNRHGPARPGHLSRHMLEEVERKRGVMTGTKCRYQRGLVLLPTVS